jgi:phage shock protein PspC (stress-responsive transcriptional regulator)
MSGRGPPPSVGSDDALGSDQGESGFTAWVFRGTLSGMSEYTTPTPSTKRLERSSSDRMIAGVSGGLGRYFDLNAAFFRLGFVVLTFLGGAGILVYLAAVLVIPDEGKERSIAAEAVAGRRERPWPLVGLGLAGIALVVLLSRVSIWPVAGLGWVLVLLAGLAILGTYDAGRGGRSVRLLWRWLVGLTITAVVIVVAAASVAVAWFDVSLGDGVGTRIEAPTSSAELKSSYELGIGNLRLDLSDIGPVTSETDVRAKVGVGELRIIVPRDVSVSANAHAKVGDVDVLSRHDAGRNAEVSTGSGGLLVIDATVGAGGIDIVRP